MGFLRWVQITTNRSSHTLRRVFLQDGLMWPSLGVLTLHVFLYKIYVPSCSFLQSLHDVLHLFMYIYLYVVLAPALPLYFLALICLRKVVNCVVPSKAGQDPLNIPTMFGSFGEMLLSIVLRTCGIAPLCFIHSPSSFSLFCSALLLPFPSLSFPLHRNNL
jgi:hypothetical protein